MRKKLKKLFPITSQTSDQDKLILIKVSEIIGKKIKNYSYLEIGSFLGGSLTPFLLDKNCKKILSIDKRNQVVEDENHEQWSYENISEKTMLENFKKHKININKLIALNGDISHLKIKGKYDLSFIDGIHTDKNVFSDFLNSLDYMRQDSIILFHDSHMIFNALILIKIFLNKNKYDYKFIKFKNSSISAIFLGKFQNNILSNNLTEDFNKFINYAKEGMLLHHANNRIKVKFRLSKFLKGKPPYRFLIKDVKKKSVL